MELGVSSTKWPEFEMGDRLAERDGQADERLVQLVPQKRVAKPFGAAR